MSIPQINTIQNLLDQVSGLTKKYQEIAAITGENFNVFNILGVSTAEVRTHSTLLAELLNPQGSHGMKDAFLQLFIELLVKKDENLKSDHFETQNARVEVEKWVGYIDTEKGTGGYVDIVVNLRNNRTIVIENKIHAGDQDGQLRRYHNHYKSQNAILVYLTLDGKEADEFTTKNNLYEHDLIAPILLSYKDEIKLWLEESKKEAVNFPIIRETLTQYIYLIKELTHQTMNENMKEEIIKVLLASGQNLIASFDVANSMREAKSRLLQKLAEQLKNKIHLTLPEINIEISSSFGNQFEEINFKLPGVEDEYVMLSFLSDHDSSYLEIINNENRKGNQIAKSDFNIEYYKQRLSEYAKPWGKVENMSKGWHGDWVCRYTKFDRHLVDNQFWSDLADNRIDSIIEDLSIDILILIDALKEKTIKLNSLT